MELAKITPRTVRRESGKELANLHRHLHGLYARGEVDRSFLEDKHRVVVGAMRQRGMIHNVGDELDERATPMRGLYLIEPHGELVWRGKKKAMAKSRRFDLEGETFALCSDGPDAKAYGYVRFRAPEKVPAAEFDKPEWFKKHRVTAKERRRWWPKAEHLWVYGIADFQKFEEPKPVEVPHGVQTFIREVDFKAASYQPDREREARLVKQADDLPETIVLAPRAVNVTGSLVYGQHVPRDTDVVTVGAEWRAEEEQFVVPLTPTFKIKLERALRAAFGVGNYVQYISEGAGATFDHLPLYALTLTKLPEMRVEHVSDLEPDFAKMCYDKKAIPGNVAFKTLTESALDRHLRGASDEIKRQAMRTYREDKVAPGRMVLSLKPLRPAPQGERQVVQHFYNYIEENLDFPLYVSAKRDGATHYVHSDGKRVWFYSDDGEDNTERLPNLAEAFRKKYKGKSFVFGVEIEKWIGGDHYPREAAIGDVKKGEDGDLAANVFRVVYWDGKDLHGRPFSEIWETMRGIPADSRSDGKLWPRRDGPINVVPHYKVGGLAGLKKRVERVAYRPGVEGVVVKRADGIFPLDGEPGRPPTAVKWHKSLDAKVRITGKTETKTAGVYVYSFSVGDMEIGKTFGSKTKLNVGNTASVECEQLNVEKDGGGKIVRVSFWAPELMGKAEGKPESLETVIARARKHGVLREKVRREDGTIEYLPNEAGRSATAYKAALEDYPDESKELRYVVQVHFRGKSAHLDPRFEYRRGDDDHLKGMTVACQQPDAIKEPVTTMEQAEKAVADPGNWKMDLKTGLVKPREIRGGVVRRGDLRAFPKGVEIPEDWLGMEGVTDKPDPGEPVPAGATKQYPGVFVIVAKGRVDWGAQKPYFQEYFLDGTWKGRWAFRMIGREKKGFKCLETGQAFGEEELDGAFLWDDKEFDWVDFKAEILAPGVEEERPRTKTYWVLMQPKDQTPYVLDKDAIDKDWLPPKGVSCLPRAVRKKVPEALRYWEVGGAEALERRAKLAEVEELGGPEMGKKQAGRWRPYVLQRHWWRGQIVIRWGPSTEHHDLRVKLDGEQWHLVLDGNPLKKDELAAYEETKETGDVTTAEGKWVGVFDVGKEPVSLKPGTPANPTKDTPAFIQTVDTGECRAIGDAPEFRKVEFKGGKMRGAWIFRREEPGSDLGTFSRSAGPKATKAVVTVLERVEAGPGLFRYVVGIPIQKRNHD